MIPLSIIGTSGVWTNVTPGNADLATATINGVSNYGTRAMVAHPTSSGVLWTTFDGQGVWKSSDYGGTWIGPIDTGGNAWSIYELGISSAALYAGGINGPSIGFWKSTDGGVTWVNKNIAALAGNRQDVYGPRVDPYDDTHLIMCGHEQDALVHSTDAGETWTSISMNAGMNQGAGTAFLFFIDTGVPSTTRTTWLYLAQGSAGAIGTWRTANSGTSWTKVDNNEHPHGACRIYQPDTSGLLFMAGIYSALGQGVLRSTDYGATWAHVGGDVPATCVFGTPSSIWSNYSWAAGLTANVPPLFQKAAQPGATGWASPGDPGGMLQGPANAVVVSDGIRRAIVTANWGAGLWRYIE